MKNFPLLSFLFPVIFNAVFVGAEIAIVSGEEAFLPVFFMNMLTVGLGEAVVVFTLGTLIYKFFSKNDRMRGILS